jgi:hypothetical protein
MSSIRDERHDRMDKKNDHSRKHGQRHSFIDARAANHCYDFHIFPHARTRSPAQNEPISLVEQNLIHKH